MPDYVFKFVGPALTDIQKYADPNTSAVINPSGIINTTVTIPSASALPDLIEYMKSQGFIQNSAPTTSEGFSGYSTSTATINSTTFIDLPINVYYVTLDTACFSHTLGTAPITILKTGIYMFSTTVTISGAALLSNTSSTRLSLDTGSGFNAVAGTTIYAQHPALSNSNGSCSITIELALSVGDIIKVQSNRASGGSNLAFVNNSCSVNIRRMS